MSAGAPAVGSWFLGIARKQRTERNRFGARDVVHWSMNVFWLACGSVGVDLPEVKLYSTYT